MSDTIKVIDLKHIGENSARKTCEVCIVGAGAAGIYIATSFAKKGINVILLEAGSDTSADFQKIGFGVDFLKSAYSGATKGRYFGLGGTTSHWGGTLVPHTNCDEKAFDQDDFNAWKSIVKTVKCESQNVLKKLDWKVDSEFEDFKNSKINNFQKKINKFGLVLMQSLHMPFKKKNFQFLLDKPFFCSFDFTIFLNSVAYDWDASKVDGKIKIHSVYAKSKNGNKVQIKAEKFIVSSGAIESTRILLEINKKFHFIDKESSALGHYLSDHISLPIAIVREKSCKDAIKSFSPYFSYGWMRGFRFVLESPKTPRAFFHFVFTNNNPGFLLVKNILAAFQRRSLPKIPLSEFVFGLLGLLKIGIFRYIFSTLYISKNTNIYMQLDMEQAQNYDNYIALGSDIDDYGRSVAKINWHISKCDIKNSEKLAGDFLKLWGVLSDINLKAIKGGDIENVFDAYHPTGTCRMGGEKDSVVDKNLKVYGLENAWVVSTAVLPSAGSANPTFTMLCLAEQLVAQLAACNGKN